MHALALLNSVEGVWRPRVCVPGRRLMEDPGIHAFFAPNTSTRAWMLEPAYWLSSVVACTQLGTISEWNTGEKVVLGSSRLTPAHGCGFRRQQQRLTLADGLLALFHCPPSVLCYRSGTWTTLRFTTFLLFDFSAQMKWQRSKYSFAKTETVESPPHSCPRWLFCALFGCELTRLAVDARESQIRAGLCKPFRPR